MAYEIILGRTAKERKSLGTKGTTFIGRHFVQMGQTTSLSNDVYLDVASTHVLFVCGKRGGGKSYTLGVIAEGMADLPAEIKDNLSIVLFDTMGVFWTMKYPNREGRKMLQEWELEPRGMEIKIFAPKVTYEDYLASNIPADASFSINPAELSPQDWWEVFDLKASEPLAVLIERVILGLKERKESFGVDDIVQSLKKERGAERDAAVNRFEAAAKWGVFDEDATPLESIVEPGKVSVLDLSSYATISGGWRIRALVIAIVSQKLFEDRMLARKQEELAAVHESSFGSFKKKMPLVWLFIDEAHEFLPNDYKTVATDALVTILREGRQPGISLVLASQQPGKIHTDVMTQADIVLSHPITAKIDTDALQALTQSYMREGLDKQLNLLPKEPGAAVVLDDKNEKVYAIKVRPRMSWHGGETATALKTEKKVFSF